MLIRSPKGPFEAASPENVLSDDLMAYNSGNLLFLEAAYKLLDTRGTEIAPDRQAAHKMGAPYINEHFDVYVVTLANAFRPSFEKSLGLLTKVIEDLTIPVVVLGVGLQAPLPYDPSASRPFDGTVKAFVKAVLDRSGSIGVRGEYTQDYLRQLGFRDVEVIGCPSMFLHGSELLVTKRTPTLGRDARIAMNVTSRVREMAPLVMSHVERYPNLRYIAQDRIALRLMLWGEDPKTASETSPMPVHVSHPLFRDDKTLFFVDPWPWLEYMRTVDFTFGTRIHGNIAALLAGTPSYVLAHDTRTLELARYFEIPHRVVAGLPPETDAADLYAEADYGPMIAGHAERFRTFIAYVERHGPTPWKSIPARNRTRSFIFGDARTSAMSRVSSSPEMSFATTMRRTLRLSSDAPMLAMPAADSSSSSGWPCQSIAGYFAVGFMCRGTTSVARGR